MATNKRCGNYLCPSCTTGKLSKQCALRHLKRRLPIIKWLPTCTINSLLYDLAGGLTVGLTAVPQSLAYAQLASMPLETGLYTTIISSFTYFFLGTARDVNLGPTSLISLLTGSIIDEVGLFVHQLLCFFTGIIMIVFAFFRLEILLNIFPITVTTGFTSAAAILIVTSQLKYFFGIKKLPRSFVELIPAFFRRINETNLWDFAAGMVVLTFLLILQYTVPVLLAALRKRKQTRTTKFVIGAVTIFTTLRAIIVIIVCAAIAYAITEPGQASGDKVKAGNNTLCLTQQEIMNCSNQTVEHYTTTTQHGLTLTGPVPRGLPKPEVPPFGGLETTVTIQSILPGNETFGNSTIIEMETTELLSFATLMMKINIGIIIIPVISTIELLAIGRAIGQKNGYAIDASQEMLACGMAHIFGSFFNAYPSSSSITRSALNSQCQVKTPLCSAFTAILVLVASATIADIFLPYVPKSCLAAVVIAAACSMVDVEMAKTIWKVNRIDSLTTAITFIACLLLDIEYGIMVGVVAALVISAILSMRSIRQNVRIKEVTLPSATSQRCLLITMPEGELRYPCADSIKKLWDQTSSHLGPIVIDCSTVREIDYSTIIAILHLTKNPPKKKNSLASSYSVCITGLHYRLLEKFRNALIVLKITQPSYRNVCFASDIFASVNMLEKVDSSDCEQLRALNGGIELTMHDDSKSASTHLSSVNRRKSM